MEGRETDRAGTLYRLGRFAKTTPTCIDQNPGPACLVVLLPTILLPGCLRTLLQVHTLRFSKLLYLLDPATSTPSVLPV
jgi:hypothetical protein